MDDNRIYKAIDDLRQDVKEMRREQSILKLEITRYKGFLGGLSFAFATGGALVGSIITYFKDVFS